MTEMELLASIARKIIETPEYLEPQPGGVDTAAIFIDGWIDGFTTEEIALIRTMRDSYMNSA